MRITNPEQLKSENDARKYLLDKVLDFHTNVTNGYHFALGDIHCYAQRRRIVSETWHVDTAPYDNTMREILEMKGLPLNLFLDDEIRQAGATIK